MPQYERLESPAAVAPEHTDTLPQHRVEREELQNSLALDLELLSQQVQEGQELKEKPLYAQVGSKQQCPSYGTYTVFL